MKPLEQAWDLLKAKQYHHSRTDRWIPETQTTLGQHGFKGAADNLTDALLDDNYAYSTERPDSRRGDYYVSLPKQDLRSDTRRYKIHSADDDKVAGWTDMMRGLLSTDDIEQETYKPTYALVNPTHRGQDLYNRALLGILSAQGPADIGSLSSSDRTMASATSHQKLQQDLAKLGEGYFSREGGLGYDEPTFSPLPPSQTNEYTYLSLGNYSPPSLYGDLRARDPGGLPMRIIDEPQSVEDFSESDPSQTMQAKLPQWGIY
tara:strand:- start:1144 stop:1926 length:783 start_codon:yes stop_codon:yes gene_type:complete